MDCLLPSRLIQRLSFLEVSSKNQLIADMVREPMQTHNRGMFTLSSYPSSLFKRRHFDSKIIILCVRWYITYKLSFQR